MKAKLLRLTPVDSALRIFVNTVSPKVKESEEIPVTNAVGRILYDDVRSTVKIPRYPTSIWDGYAVMSIDLQKASPRDPVRLKIVGKLFPNSLPSDVELGTSETAYVGTGAPIPEGADAMVKMEDVTLINSFVEVHQPVSKGENVSRPGEDIKKGIILEEGHVIRPQDLDLLANVGIKRVVVLRKPRIAIISVGDELVEFDKACIEEERKRADSHAVMLIGLARELGWDPIYLGVAPDNVEDVTRKIRQGLDVADVVLTVAGIFVGENDHVSKAVSALGGRLLVHGVKMRPGKVVGLGVVEGKPFIALPGLIVSVLANFYTFVVPIVRHVSGLGLDGGLPFVEAKLLEDVKAKPDFDAFQLIRVGQSNRGYAAKPIRGGSGITMNVVRANGFIRVPRGQMAPKRGEMVKVTLFSPKELEHIAHSTVRRWTQKGRR